MTEYVLLQTDDPEDAVAQALGLNSPEGRLMARWLASGCSAETTRFIRAELALGTHVGELLNLMTQVAIGEITSFIHAAVPPALAPRVVEHITRNFSDGLGAAVSQVVGK